MCSGILDWIRCCATERVADAVSIRGTVAARVAYICRRYVEWLTGLQSDNRIGLPVTQQARCHSIVIHNQATTTDRQYIGSGGYKPIANILIRITHLVTIIVRILRRIPARQIVHKVPHIVGPRITDGICKPMLELALDVSFQRVEIGISIVRCDLYKGVLSGTV